MEKRINNIITYLFAVFIFIIPLIFSVSTITSFQFTKIIPFFIVVFIAAFFSIIVIFNQGKIVMPWHWLFVAGASIPLVYIISSFTSIHSVSSFLGMGTEIGTASTITGLFLLMYFVSSFVRSKDKAFVSYMAFGAAYLLIALFHIVRLAFGPDFLSFSIFTSLISNTVGRFSDLGIVSGIAVLLSLTSIEFLRLGKVVRVISYVMLVGSLTLLSVANFPLLVFGPATGSSISLFTLIGFFAMIFFVYFVSSSYGVTKKKEVEEVSMTSVSRIPVASLVVLVVSIVFTIGGVRLQESVLSFFKVVPATESRLLWSPTANLSVSTLKQFSVRPFLGYGPEQFSYKWMLDKPIEINNSPLWNSTFTYGTGFIASSIVTVGILGFLGWIAFLAILFWLGTKAIFMKNKDPFSHYILVSSFLVSVYLWIAAVVYIPSLVTFMLTFFFTGLFIASLFREKVLVEKEVLFDHNKGKSFAYILGLVCALILLLLWGYKLGERVTASAYVNKANSILLTASSFEDLDKAKVYLRSAASLDNESVYSSALASITLLKVNSVLQNATSTEKEKIAVYQNEYQEAVLYAQNAIKIEPRSFVGFISYGNVLSVAVPLGAEGFYEAAKDAYEEAGKLNPKNPLVPYLLAELEATKGNMSDAKARTIDALNLKNNYVDAIVFLGRLQLGEGSKRDALNTFTVAQSIDPQNATIQAIINSLKSSYDTEVSAPTATSTDKTN